MFDEISVFVNIVVLNLDFCMKTKFALVVSDDNFLRTVECLTFALFACSFLSDVVQTENHILRRNRDRSTVCRVKDVVRSKHKDLCFHNGSVAQRQVYSHLVTIEVGVECRTYERVKLDCLSFDKFWLECLNTKTVQRRSTVK